MAALFEVGEALQLREIQKLHGHTDRVWGLAWNSVSTGAPALLASCSGDKTVRIWEQSLSGSFECKAVLDETHTRTVRSCAWSPSGKMLATASFDATTAIWENVGGDYECVSSLEGHENEVKSVSWNASGSLLATCGRDKSVWIWVIEPGNEFDCISVLQGHTQDVKMVVWHPHLDLLLSCSYDNSIKIWAEDGDDDWHCVQTLNASNWYTPEYVIYYPVFIHGISSSLQEYPSMPVKYHETIMGCYKRIFFDPTSADDNKKISKEMLTLGDKMVSCSDDLTIKIWGTDNDLQDSSTDFVPWKHLCTLSGYHDRTIFSVHLSRDGIIATGAADDGIRLFVENNNGGITAFRENGDGYYVWDDPYLWKHCSDQVVRRCLPENEVDEPMYKLLSKKERAHEMDVNCVQWSPMQNQLLASASDDGTIKIWELGSQA